MPQETGLPDGSKSKPRTGRLSLPPKKREVTERKAVVAKAGPRGAVGAGPAAPLRPCLPGQQQEATEALPGDGLPGHPAVRAGAGSADRTEPGCRLPTAARLPVAHAPPARAQVYYGLALSAAVTNELDAAGAKARLRPPRGGEEKPPADTRDVPAVPLLIPTRLAAPVAVSPAAPSRAPLCSRPLCPTVVYSQCRTRSPAQPAPAGGVWSMLLPTASTALALPHFQRGSLTVLPGGERKRVEELRTEDFLRCAGASPELRIGSCVVQGIRSSPHAGFASLQVYLREQDRQVSADVLREYPFFARGRGWVSCCPRTTSQLYQLPCQQLAVGDVCMVWSLPMRGRDAPGARPQPPDTPRVDAEP